LRFNDRLKLMRKTLKLKQIELAKKIDVKYINYNRYEVGFCEPNIEILSKLNTIINVNINWLITGNGPMFIPNSETDNSQVTGKSQDYSNDDTNE